MSNPAMGNNSIGQGNFPGWASAQSANSGSNGLANAYNLYAQQAGLTQMTQSAAAQQHAWNSIHARNIPETAKWMVDGKTMTFQEFVQAVFPEDTPERTFFLLKYTK